MTTTPALQPQLNVVDPSNSIVRKSFNWSLDWALIQRPLVFALWAWAMGRVGLSILWVTLVSLLMVFSIVRQRKHFQFHQTLRFQRLMHEPAALQRSLPLIPPWISFPDIEKADFIGTIAAQLWPSIKTASETVVTNSITPIMDKLKPGFLTSLQFNKLDLGNIPPNIPGVQLQQSEAGEIMLDIEVEFSGNPMISVEAKSGPAFVVVHIADFFFRSTIRVLLKPLMNEIPCFGALGISFVRKPEINFKFSTVGVSIMAIPGLNDFLYDLIKNQIAAFVVWPKKIIIPIKPLSSDVLAQLSAAEPEGILQVTVLGGTDIHPGDTYAKISVGKESKKTETKRHSGNVEWTDSFEFLVHDPGTEDVVIALKNKENVLMSSFNLITDHIKQSKSEAVGDLKFPINRVCGSDSKVQAEQDLWLPLQHQQKHQKNGQLHVQLVWKPFKRHEGEESSQQQQQGGGSTPGHHDHQDESADASSRPSLNRRISTRGASTGLLILTIHSAAGLRRQHGGNVSSVYIKGRVGGHEVKTRSASSSGGGEPFRWDSQFELGVIDSKTQNLVLEVCDKSTLNSLVRVTKDHVLGVLTVPVSRIQKEGRKMQTLPLEKALGGTVTITAELKETD